MRLFYELKSYEKAYKRNDTMKKEKKDYKISVRLNQTQSDVLKKLIEEGTCKTDSAAIQYIINMAIIKGII